MKNFILALSASLFLLGCASSSQDATVPKGKCTIDNVKGCEVSKMPVAGTYKTTLPCASCSGIDATLTLNADGTFTNKMIYQSKDKFTDTSKGRYIVVGDTVTTTDEYKEKTSYKFDGKNLYMLNADGTMATGEFKDNYTFKPIN
ncbi:MULTISPECIES: copper resistance protein NlpE [Campylobacter]|uniref:copper resistance protein NlpE n=1 Tax=Campylobacter TaxID=194 RepID=UPI00146FF6B5|nr:MULTISPECIES: copper resistance protein NlpE [Campylobacter]MBN7287638.1 copper resistance protein NlpE N-terminal domain-containing protein [Campylobacter curvus]MDU6826491.1 copper resistance protein NlpE [Campylobacter sp.]